MDGPEPWRRKSDLLIASARFSLEGLPSALIVPFTIPSLGKRLCSMAATSSERSAEAHRVTWVLGRCFSRRARRPGVWAMSPRLTTCQEERRRMCLGGAPAARERAEARRAAVVEVRKWRRFIGWMIPRKRGERAQSGYRVRYPLLLPWQARMPAPPRTLTPALSRRTGRGSE